MGAPFFHSSGEDRQKEWVDTIRTTWLQTNNEAHSLKAEQEIIRFALTDWKNILELELVILLLWVSGGRSLFLYLWYPDCNLWSWPTILVQSVVSMRAKEGERRVGYFSIFQSMRFVLPASTHSLLWIWQVIKNTQSFPKFSWCSLLGGGW